MSATELTGIIPTASSTATTAVNGNSKPKSNNILIHIKPNNNNNNNNPILNSTGTIVNKAGFRTSIIDIPILAIESDNDTSDDDDTDTTAVAAALLSQKGPSSIPTPQPKLTRRNSLKAKLGFDPAAVASFINPDTHHHHHHQQHPHHHQQNNNTTIADTNTITTTTPIVSNKSLDNEDSMYELTKQYDSLLSTDNNRSNIPFLLYKSHYYLLPNSIYVYLWSYLILFTILYNLIITPLYAFQFQYLLSNINILVLDYTIDILYLFDFIIRNYYIISINDWNNIIIPNSNNNNSYLYLDWSDYRIHSDIISLIPFELLSLISYPLGNRLQCLLRLTKVFRINRLIYSNQFDTVHFSLRLFKLLCSIMIIIHWIGMFVFGISEYQLSTFQSIDSINAAAAAAVIEDTNSTAIPTVSTALSMTPWIRVANIEISDYETRYINSIYFMFVMFLTTGYGDLLPSTNIERLISILVMVSGVMVASILLSICSLLIANLDRSAIRLEQGLDEIENIFNQYKSLLPIELKRETIITHTNLWRIHRGFNLNTVLDYLPPAQSIQTKLYLYSKLVTRLPWFSRCGDGFITDIVKRLNTKLLHANEFLFKQGHIGESMFFLVVGTARVFRVEGDVKIFDKTIGSGVYVGEMAVIMNQRRAASVLTITHCEFCELSKFDFRDVLHMHPKSAELVIKEANKRHTEDQRRVKSQDYSEDNKMINAINQSNKNDSNNNNNDRTNTETTATTTPAITADKFTRSQAPAMINELLNRIDRLEESIVKKKLNKQQQLTTNTTVITINKPSTAIVAPAAVINTIPVDSNPPAASPTLINSPSSPEKTNKNILSPKLPAAGRSRTTTPAATATEIRITAPSTTAAPAMPLESIVPTATATTVISSPLSTNKSIIIPTHNKINTATTILPTTPEGSGPVYRSVLAQTSATAIINQSMATATATATVTGSNIATQRRSSATATAAATVAGPSLNRTTSFKTQLIANSTPTTSVSTATAAIRPASRSGSIFANATAQSLLKSPSTSTATTTASASSSSSITGPNRNKRLSQS